MEYNFNFITIAMLLIILILAYIIFTLKRKTTSLTKQIGKDSRYKKFLEAFPVPVFYKDIDGNITYTNPSFDLSFGTNKNKTIQTLIKLLKNPLEQMELNYDNNIQKRAIIFSSNLYNSSSQIEGKIGTIFDINNFKKDITSLLIWKQRYSLAIEGPQYGLWDWNILENSFYFSLRWKKIMEYEDNERPDNLSSWLNLVDSRDMARVNEALNEHLSGLSDVFDIEHRVKSKNGLKWVHVRGKAIVIQDMATRMTGLIADISERKKVENKLSKNQRLFADFMDNLPGIAFIKNINSRYIYINRYFENIIGFKNFRNKTPNELFDKITAQNMLKNDQRAFYQNQKIHKESIPTLEGIPINFEIYQFPVSDENGEKFLCGFGVELTTH